jgi:uncharacterized protein (DUF1499 family)
MKAILQRGLPVLIVLALLVALSFPVTALLTKFGVLHFRTAFAVLGGLAVCAALLFMISGFLFVFAQHEGENGAARTTPLVTIVILLIPLGFVVNSALLAKRVPFIHDVTTDPDNPPLYKHAHIIRGAADNPLDYDPAAAALQRKGYPDIVPVAIPGSLSSVFAQVEREMHTLGWNITYQDAEAGHLEATQTSFWFGFVDDIVVRLSAQPDTGTVRVDVRSVSRMGKSDLGVNAARINRLLTALLPSD